MKFSDLIFFICSVKIKFLIITPEQEADYLEVRDESPVTKKQESAAHEVWDYLAPAHVDFKLYNKGESRKCITSWHVEQENFQNCVFTSVGIHIRWHLWVISECPSYFTFGLLAGCCPWVVKESKHKQQLILNRRKWNSSTQALRDLHWLPIRERIYYKILVTVFNCIQGKTPEYLINLLCKQVIWETVKTNCCELWVQLLENFK